MLSSAPGKIILLGEYAVLDGGPALVAAVERRVECVFEPGAGLEVEAVGLGTMRRVDDGWGGHDLPFIRALADAAPDGRYRIDSTALGAETDAGWCKLGLGSSAAATVAFAARLPGLDTPQKIYAAAQRAHRGVQGTGSGADVAASAFGGLIGYRWGVSEGGIPAGDGRGLVETLEVPPALRALVCIWTGRAASTTELVGRVDAFAAEHPERHRALMARLADHAREGIAAVRLDDLPGLADAARATGRTLEQLTVLAGAPIVTATHRTVEAVARRFDAVAKPTGAGGGDLAWVLPSDPDAADAIVAAAAEAGLRGWRLQLAARGAHRHEG